LVAEWCKKNLKVHGVPAICHSAFAKKLVAFTGFVNPLPYPVVWGTTGAQRGVVEVV